MSRLHAVTHACVVSLLATTVALALPGCPGGAVNPGSGNGPKTQPPLGYDAGMPPATYDGGSPPVQPPPSSTCTQPTATISGTVYAPNGQDPVPNASVSLRQSAPQPFPTQVACELCTNTNTQGSLMQVKSGYDGKFTLSGVCPGNVQLVLQNGRFRRVLALQVTPSSNMALPANETRFPRRAAEANPADTVPKIAVATGEYDQMECVLKKMGLDDDQIELYDASSLYGAAPSGPSFAQLLSDLNRMKQYNVIFINCGNTAGQLLQQPNIRSNIGQYVRSGGRLYVTDLSYDWIEQIPELAAAIDFEPGPSASTPEPTMVAAVGSGGLVVSATVKDQQLGQWLALFPGAINNGRTTIEHFSEGWAMVHQAAKNTKVWVEGQVSGRDVAPGVRPLTITFNFNNCGKILFSSYHTAGSGGFNPHPDPTLPLSQRCAQQPLSPQERILEYLIFDIANCVRPIQ